MATRMKLANFLNCSWYFLIRTIFNCLVFSENNNVNRFFFSLVLLGPWKTLYLILDKNCFAIFLLSFLSTEAMLNTQTEQL